MKIEKCNVLLFAVSSSRRIPPGDTFFPGIDDQIIQNLLHAPPVCPHENGLLRQLILQLKIGVRDVNQEPPEVRKAKKKLPFGLKLFVALLLFAYYEGVMAALAFTDIVSVKDIIFYSVIGALAGVCLVAFIAYVAVIAKNRKKQHYVPVNDVLTDLVENVKEFDEIAKVTYFDPLAEEPEEKEPAPDALPAVTVEDVKEETYDLSFTEGEELEVEHVTFNEICSNFQSYVRHFGVQVDIASVRSLIAAVSASKIVVVSSKNTEVLPDFLTALSEYFHSGKVTSAGVEWGATSDLLWKRDGDKFAVSDFVNSVYSATKAPERLCAAVVDGVRAESITFLVRTLYKVRQTTRPRSITLL